MYNPIDLNMNSELVGGNILVTGGTGTFGKSFVKFCLDKLSPRRLVIYSRDEMKQYEMAKNFPEERYPCLRYFVGDVRDLDRLKLAFRGVDYIVHAAAMKHVTAAEYNPTECVRTNIYGAENVVQAAMANEVRKVIALSTDKASNPINLYGASKLASDKIFINANGLSGDLGTRFSVVRYGNVLGSRGSVIPLFKKLNEEGCTTVPVTDKRMTRFVIKINDGVGFVINSFDLMQGGEVFVPELPSIRIVDLVSAMLPKASMEIVGIRPGEKLHETMISKDEGRMVVRYDDYYIIEPQSTSWRYKSYMDQGGEMMGEGYSYDSELNPNFLDIAEISELIKGL